MSSKRVALVDNNESLVDSLTFQLTEAGFDVDGYFDGETALQGLRQRSVDVVILDYKMPRLNGHEVLERLRRRSNIPVIFLTSADQEPDEAVGLGLGADDYVTKPFSVTLLIARIRALLRRQAMEKEDLNPTGRKEIVCGDLTLDKSRHLCTWKNQLVKLTLTEFLILSELASRPGHVKDRESLMSAAYDDSRTVIDRTIDSHIKRIRRKFKEVDADFEQIETLYNIGYRYRMQD